MSRLALHRLHPDARIPRYETDGAAGLDLAARLDAPEVLAPGERRLIPTGIAIALPPRHEAQIRPRSGLAYKHGITVLNSPGTVDEDYRGELKVLLINHGQESFTVEPGMRVAQMVIAAVAHVDIVEVDSVEALGETARGAGGYGSTGA